MIPSLSIIFAGSGEFGLPTFDALLASSHRVVQVVSQPDRPAGRGRKLTPTPIAQRALDRNLPLIRPDRIAAESLGPADVMVVIAFGQKVPESHVHHPRLGSINLHASLLPRYRGAAPIHHAILAGETVTGNSVIRLAQKMDAGAILGQSRRDISPTLTTGELHDLLAADGPSLVLNVLSQLAAGQTVETPQDESAATLAPKLSRESSLLDLQQPADLLRRKINALSPWPGCRVRLHSESGGTMQATLVRAGPSEVVAGAKPGALTPAGFLAAGAQTSLQILEIQPESKRPMKWTDFRNGFPAPSSLEPIL